MKPELVSNLPYAACTKKYATLWVAYLFARRDEKRHPILRERSEQAKSRQNSPVDCFAVERRIPDGALSVARCISESRIPLALPPRWRQSQFFLPSSCQPMPAPTRVRPLGHILESGFLHPPQALLSRLTNELCYGYNTVMEGDTENGMEDIK